MKVVILCGGKGTRLREETEYRPKPMVEIGGRPILWHILKIYSAFGFDEFVLALGYKGEVIKQYSFGRKPSASICIRPSLKNMSIWFLSTSSFPPLFEDG